MVIEKPAGLLTVPGKHAHLSDCLESRARAVHSGARIVHRLDMDTSGLIVLGLTADAHRALSRQFEMRQVTKMYRARVFGTVAGEGGVIDWPLRCDWPNRPLQMVDAELGRPALTAWQAVGRSDCFTDVLLFPKTGRSHQLRVHMAALGHPILGDRFYAHEAALAASDRLCLHAAELGFAHPATGKALWFESLSPF